MVIGIAPSIGILHIVTARAALVDIVVGKECTLEGQRLFIKPLGIVTLMVIYIAVYVSRVAKVIDPTYIGGVVDERIVGIGSTLLILVGAVVSDAIVMYGGGSMVLTASQFVPCIVGETIIVDIITHEHDARLTRAALPRCARVGVGIAVKGIAEDLDIHLARSVLYQVVEAKGDIPSITAQGDEHAFIVCNALLGLASHILGRVTLIVVGHLVDKLARGRAILIHPADVGRLCSCCKRGRQGYNG